MKRYDRAFDYGDGGGEMEESPDGDWVYYTDVAALEAERDALKAENERLREALEASRIALTYAIGALQGGIADSNRTYLIDVLVTDERAVREALGEGR